MRHLERGGLPTVEPYHAALRAAVRSVLPPEGRRQLHQKIAARLRAADPEGAAEHLGAAGRGPEAALLCSEAAEIAARELAFDRAAVLLGLALAHCEPSDPRWLRWTERRAEALHRAGRTHAAGLLLLEASRQITSESAHRLHQRAGELLLLSGDVAGGLALLEGALGRNGFALPSNLEETLRSAALAYVQLAGRGLGYDARPEGATDLRTVEAIDLHVTLAQSMSHVDLRALPLAVRALHLALDHGEIRRIQKACAVFVWNTASHMPNDLVGGALALCEELTPRLSGSYARALLHEARAEYFHFATDFLRAEAECERAEHLFVTECSGVGRELAGTRTGAAFIQYSHKGDFESRVEQTLGWMADARMRGNAYHYNMLTVAHALVWVARDRPDQARDELRAAEARWPGGVGVFEVSVVLTLDAVDRYEGGDPRALAPAQGRSAVLHSPAVETPLVKNYLCLHRAWLAVCLLARGTDPPAMREQLGEAVSELRALDLGVSRAIADAMEANGAVLDGARETALHLLEQSERGFRTTNMLCFAACARKRRGQLTNGPVGERVEREADRELRELGIRDPDKWSRAYFSPFRVSAEQLLTISTELP